MKWLMYLTILGIFVSGISSHRLVRQTSENGVESEVEAPEEATESGAQEVEPSEVQEAEPTEAQEAEPTEAQELEGSEFEEAEPTEPAELGEPVEAQSESEIGAALSSSVLVVGENAIPGGGEQAVDQRGSVLGGEDSSSEEDVQRGAAINQNAELNGGDSSQEHVQRGAAIIQNSELELNGGDSSQEDVEGGMGGGAGLGGVPMASEGDNTIGAGTQLIPTGFIATTGIYRSTGNPLREPTPTRRFDNRGDAFIGDFGPQEGTRNELGSGPGDEESSTSSQKIGVIVGATTAGTVAVVAGVAIAYVKLKGAVAAGAA